MSELQEPPNEKPQRNCPARAIGRVCLGMPECPGPQSEPGISHAEFGLIDNKLILGPRAEEIIVSWCGTEPAPLSVRAHQAFEAL